MVRSAQFESWSLRKRRAYLIAIAIPVFFFLVVAFIENAWAHLRESWDESMEVADDVHDTLVTLWKKNSGLSPKDPQVINDAVDL
jgi:hypothetical protein